MKIKAIMILQRKKKEERPLKSTQLFLSELVWTIHYISLKNSNNISVDNRIEWSPIQSVIIQMINKI